MEVVDISSLNKVAANWSKPNTTGILHNLCISIPILNCNGSVIVNSLLEIGNFGLIPHALTGEFSSKFKPFCLHVFRFCNFALNEFCQRQTSNCTPSFYSNIQMSLRFVTFNLQHIEAHIDCIYVMIKKNEVNQLTSNNDGFRHVFYFITAGSPTELIAQRSRWFCSVGVEFPKWQLNRFAFNRL